MIVGQGLIALAVGAGGVCSDIFTLLSLFSSRSPSLWETAVYRLKYCLNETAVKRKTTKQPWVWLGKVNKVNYLPGRLDFLCVMR